MIGFSFLHRLHYKLLKRDIKLGHIVKEQTGNLKSSETST